jgi:hypothetical protein
MDRNQLDVIAGRTRVGVGSVGLDVSLTVSEA